MNNSICKVCSSASYPLFTAMVLRKYSVQYYRCGSCGFIQTEEPHWLDEAYKQALVDHDTGIMARNIYFSRVTTHLIQSSFDPNGIYVDFAGGYGIFTRLMRDMGFNFYWSDPYAENLVARGFEYQKSIPKPTMITAFEVFEHLNNPLTEIERMFAQSENILFTTRLVPDPVPQPSDWWYYSFEGGQHIALYTVETLNRLAEHFGKHLLTNGKSVHLLSSAPVSRYKFNIALYRAGIEMKIWSFGGRTSKTESDMNDLMQHESY